MKVMKTLCIEYEVALYLQTKENVSKYIQDLIRNDMKKEKEEEKSRVE